MKPVGREFVNELGNRISIVVTREVVDLDALCTSCRWRGTHAPECERAGEPFPMIELPDSQVLIRIEGPLSASENFLTSMEVRELTAVLVAFEGEPS